MNAFAFDRVEVSGQRGDERLAFARDHFGDVAFVQDHAAQHLHVVMAQADEAATAFATDCERFDEDVVNRLAGLQPSAEFGGLIPQLLIGHRLVLRFERGDRFDPGLQSLQESRIGRTEQAGNAAFEPAEQRVADAGDDFPNAFENFHDKLYGGMEPGGSRSTKCGNRFRQARRNMRMVRNVAPPKSL